MLLAAGYTSGPLKSKVDYEEVVVFFQFRDGHKFKRFNDACIARLSTLKDIRVFVLVYEKAEYIGKARYRKKFTSELSALYQIRALALPKKIWRIYMTSFTGQRLLRIPG